jgi:predicted nuclease with RNAse H fold
MDIISIDLPWKETKQGARALALADKEGKIKIASAADDDELLRIVRDSVQPSSLVLLDVPIAGTENLGEGKYQRPVDMALLRQGIWVLPSRQARARGRELQARLNKELRGITIQEIYPYAVYKFLAYLRQKKLLSHLKQDKSSVLLDDDFRAYRPPKYKREQRREKLLANMKFLYSLLTDPDLGLRFSPPLPHPDDSLARGGLNELGDEYDACLGAIAGIHYASGSPYAYLAGEANSGSILLLADRWLAARLNNERGTGARGS